MLPILLVVISKDKYYKAFYKIAHNWGKLILFGTGFWSEVKTLQKIEKEKSYMFIANHTSMIDIMLMLSVVKNPCVFVGKEELTKIPLFGYVFKRTSITVNRGNTKSRKAVFDEAQKRLNKGLSICIFPEGLVPDDESVVLSDFKNGAFRLAIEHQIPIVPMTFFDCKKRFSYTFFSGKPGKLRVKIHPFFETKELNLKNREELKNKAFNLIYNELISDSKNT
ncbi:1-acyl-sn-glycerol-3-phosphate acyltransferase [Lutibacter oricola]|uniref:1-acyl-sn-glycerol-3-phosphate acyltransferase n=1 Tax=Lutibacter oricola TaxID=762486 RepID=A0A1H2QKP2_9FLAO|nr:lysophospholipid acyltransferase family protein [Lutibacter oricola]SDW06979.1 1-acyl-sn-glycerol-3-phosphate acyltransferase [Lutibacter oricola]